MRADRRRRGESRSRASLCLCKAPGAAPASAGPRTPAAAQWSCLSGNCTAGNGRAQHRGTDGVTRTYTGAFRDGRLHGMGVIEFSNGERHEGAFGDGYA